MDTNNLIFLLMAAAGIVCLGAAPLSLGIRGSGKKLRLYVRYFWFYRDISGMARKLLQTRINLADFPKILKMLEVFVRHPPQITHFRLKMAFSTGDAAETALLYGFLSLFFSALYPNLRACNGEIVLTPCFLPSDSLSIDCDIIFSLPAAVFLIKLLQYCWPRLPACVLTQHLYPR
jgi:hypothetical protein